MKAGGAAHDHQKRGGLKVVEVKGWAHRWEETQSGCPGAGQGQRREARP